jgi:anti-sigma B factor antagonist
MTFELTALPPPPGGAQAVTVVQVRGDIDATCAADLHHALARHADGALVVDLSSVGYFDSAGFAVLDKLLSRSRVAVVVAPGSVIRTAMTLMGLPYSDSIDAARASLLQA